MKKLTLLLLVLLTSCSTPTVNHVDAGYQMNKEELLSYYGFYDKGQLRTLSVEYNSYKLGLPTFVYEQKFMINTSINEAYKLCQDTIKSIGTLRSNDLPNHKETVIGSVGSGAMGMNPAGIVIYLKEAGEETLITVRAVSKEGKIKQNTSGRAVDKFANKLKSNTAYVLAAVQQNS